MMQKIAIISNVTVGLVSAKLRGKYDVYVPDGFNTMGGEIFNENTRLYSEHFDAIFVLIDGYESKGWMSEEDAQKYYDEWSTMVAYLSDKVRDTYIFISTVAIEGNRIINFSERTYFREWEYKWYAFCQAIAESQNNVFVLDIARIISDVGKDNFYSPKMWYLGSAPYSQIGIASVCNQIDLAMFAAYGRKHKGLALDLDNTLWGGVIGEDGVEGIVLSDHKEGERYYDFQKQILEMQRRGVILTVVSKNNAEEVGNVWNHPYMLIKQSDIVASEINWEEKANNILKLQNALNLSNDSFVFLDDNPVEREKMLDTHLADSPDFPTDTTQLRTFAISVFETNFKQLRTTREDGMKTAMYQQEARRNEMRENAYSYEDYLSRLDMVVDIHMMTESEIERVVQLLSKTNQFNTTVKRYSREEVIKMQEDSKIDIFTIYSSDKFGDNGLAAVVLCCKKEDSKAVYIDNFIMSCRVMGRSLEREIMSRLVMFYRPCFDLMEAEYVYSGKNKPVEKLYDGLKFELYYMDEKKKKYKFYLHNNMEGIEQYKKVSFCEKCECE